MDQETIARRPTMPRPAWAHQDGKVALKPNGAPGILPDAMDHILIGQVFARYGIAYDEAQGAVMATLFTDDAVIEAASGTGGTIRRLSGIAAVMGTSPQTAAKLRDQRRHCITNIVVQRLTAMEASAVAYGIVPIAADGLWLGASVIYTADLRKQAGLWRFSYLFIGVDTLADRPANAAGA